MILCRSLCISSVITYLFGEKKKKKKKKGTETGAEGKETVQANVHRNLFPLNSVLTSPERSLYEEVEGCPGQTVHSRV